MAANLQQQMAAAAATFGQQQPQMQQQQQQQQQQGRSTAQMALQSYVYRAISAQPQHVQGWQTTMPPTQRMGNALNLYVHTSQALFTASVHVTAPQDFFSH